MDTSPPMALDLIAGIERNIETAGEVCVLGEEAADRLTLLATLTTRLGFASPPLQIRQSKHRTQVLCADPFTGRRWWLGRWPSLGFIQEGTDFLAAGRKAQLIELLEDWALAIERAAASRRPRQKRQRG